jgi:hypothetical protein
MTAPTTQVSGTAVQVTWNAASSGGLPVTAYLTLVVNSEGRFLPAPSCNGTQSSVLSSRSCTIPITSLTSAPFELVQGSLVQAKVAALNAVGTGVFSAANPTGALI